MLSIIPYDTVDEAVEIANDTVYGLGAHVQGTDMETVRGVAAQIRSGQVHLNYPPGTRTHLSAVTSVPATAANTASRAWRNISRPRPFSGFTDEIHLGKANSNRLISHELALRAVRKALVAAASADAKVFPAVIAHASARAEHVLAQVGFDA